MRLSVLITIWLLAMLLALSVDAPISQYMRDSGSEAWFRAHWQVRDWLKAPGEFWTVVAVAAVVPFLHRFRWRAGLFVLAAASVSGINGLLKWVVGRHRPFTLRAEAIPELNPSNFLPFRDGFAGAFDGKNLSFPSGHTGMAFALATALAMLWPRWWWAFYLPALVVAAERLLENSHWLSDIIAAAGLGWASVHLVAWLSRRAGWDREDAPMVELTESAVAPAVSAAGHEGRLPVMLEVQPHSEQPPFFSLVIPAYNEQENVPTLLARVGAALGQIGRPFEVIVVDDGSSDGTPQLLREALSQYPWLRVIRMARNGGQSAAFEAGFEAARGEVIGTIDADLQNDPEEIPRLLPLLDEKSVDMVTGWRKQRQDTPFRRWQSRQANRIRNWISQETVNDSASSLKLYRAHAIKGMKLFNGAHRFFPTLVKMRGYTCFETPVKHSQRFAGTAKYGFRNRALRAFIDLLAVRWMKTRFLTYSAREMSRGGD